MCVASYIHTHARCKQQRGVARLLPDIINCCGGVAHQRVITYNKLSKSGAALAAPAPPYSGGPDIGNNYYVQRMCLKEKYIDGGSTSGIPCISKGSISQA